MELCIFGENVTHTVMCNVLVLRHCSLCNSCSTCPVNCPALTVPKAFLVQEFWVTWPNSGKLGLLAKQKPKVLVNVGYFSIFAVTGCFSFYTVSGKK